jgi:hypothetical protein
MLRSDLATGFGAVDSDIAAIKQATATLQKLDFTTPELRLRCELCCVVCVLHPVSCSFATERKR